MLPAMLLAFPDGAGRAGRARRYLAPADDDGVERLERYRLP